MRDEPNGFALWVKADLRKQFLPPPDLPPDLLHLIDKVCAPN